MEPDVLCPDGILHIYHKLKIKVNIKFSDFQSTINMIGICKKQYHLYPPKLKNAKIQMLKYKCNKILVDLWGKTCETFLTAMKEKNNTTEIYCP